MTEREQSCADCGGRDDDPAFGVAWSEPHSAYLCGNCLAARLDREAVTAEIDRRAARIKKIGAQPRRN
jgi:hypothetical protein